MNTGAVTLRIDSQLDHVFLVGLSLRAICAAVPIDEAQAAAAELAVVEAVNNAIEHAYGGEPGHPVEIDVTVTADELRVAVRDRGRSMDWPAACARAAAAPSDRFAEGGRGLYIIRSLTDTLSYATTDGWNALRMSKRLSVVDAPTTQLPRSA